MPRPLRGGRFNILPELRDPYWIGLMDELVRKGIPRCIVEPALIRADRERSTAVAYV